MTFKEDFKPTKVYNKLVNDVCYNADCLEEFEKQRLVVANPFSYNKSTRTGIVAEFDNGYHLSKDKGIVIANKDLYATEVVDIGED